MVRVHRLSSRLPAGGRRDMFSPGSPWRHAWAVGSSGSARRGGVEKQLVADAGIEFRGIPAGKLRRYLSLRNLTDLLKTAAGVVASLRILGRDKPSLLFSKGGFVSVPPVLAAWLRGIPAWTHESDFDPGLATRINMRFCEKVLVSFPETLDVPAGQLPGEGSGDRQPVARSPLRRAARAADGPSWDARMICRCSWSLGAASDRRS